MLFVGEVEIRDFHQLWGYDLRERSAWKHQSHINCTKICHALKHYKTHTDLRGPKQLCHQRSHHEGEDEDDGGGGDDVDVSLNLAVSIASVCICALMLIFVILTFEQ